MNQKIRKWLFAAVMVTVAAGCSPESKEVDLCADKCDKLDSGWVIDLRKSDSYGEQSSYFWGVTLSELRLDRLAAVIDEKNLDKGATQAFAPFGAKEATFKIVWDQLQDVTKGWPTVIFKDVATAKTALGPMNVALPQIAQGLAATGLKYEEGMKYHIVLIDYTGQAIAVPGGLKIVPMLKNTNPKDQTHIVDALDNGDIIAYVHPEQTSMNGILERRASHVAMHYEEGDIVHHIDNPNSYGPPYNHAPDRNMPFHAFRYQPNGMDEKVAAQHRESARNWAFMNNDLSPFADFFDLRLKEYDDLKKFGNTAVRNEEMPALYCSGLAYTNLNLGINMPQNKAGLGDASFEIFKQSEYYFSDTERNYSAEYLAAEPSLKSVEKLVFKPYTSIDMLNVWVGNTFRGLPPALEKSFLPIFLENEETHESLEYALLDLDWSDPDNPELRDNGAWSDVSSKMNVAAWAKSYSMELLGKTGLDFVNSGIKVVGRDGIEKNIAEVLDVKEIAAGHPTPLKVMESLYNKVVSNKFVPPRIWIDKAQAKSNNIMDESSEQNIKYIGTVINCELLSAANGSDADPCEGGSLSKVEEYAEGGADTHTYPHYAVRSGGERTHRRVNASPGPEFFGKGTVVTVRFTSEVKDTKFALHVPENWIELSEHLDDSIVEFDRYCNEQWGESKSCAPSKGILLDTKSNPVTGNVHTEEMKFSLIGDETSPCSIENDEFLLCKMIDLKTRKVTTERVSRRVHGIEKFNGHFTATMLDMGVGTVGPNGAQASDCDISNAMDADNPGRASGCMDLPGSAHFDGFHIKVRND